MFAGMALVAGGRGAANEDESLGKKFKDFFTAKPSPTPKHKRKTAPKKKPTPTPTPSPKHSLTPTPTATASPEPSARPTPESTPVLQPSVAPSPLPTETPKPRPTPMPHRTPTPTPAATPKSTPIPKSTPRPKIIPTPTSTPTAATPSGTLTPKAKIIPTLSNSPTPAPKSTLAPSSTPTPTAPPIATSTPSPTSRKSSAPNATISAAEISGYEGYPAEVRKILDLAINLTSQNLAYKYGSADPVNGGLDCSGFTNYVLSKSGLADVPRDAREQYVWVRKAGNFQAVLGHSDDTFELDALKPGDLLFWAGTYNVDRDPAITHTMIYVGREKSTNHRIMVGASDGRTYKGQSRFGVSIFDFKVSRLGAKTEDRPGPTFVGYGRIPGLRKE